MPFGILRFDKSPSPGAMRFDSFLCKWPMAGMFCDEMEKVRPGSEVYIFGYVDYDAAGNAKPRIISREVGDLPYLPDLPKVEGKLLERMLAVERGLRQVTGSKQRFDRLTAYFTEPASQDKHPFFARLGCGSPPQQGYHRDWTQNGMVLDDLAERYEHGMFFTAERASNELEVPAILSLSWYPLPQRLAETPQIDCGVLDLRKQEMRKLRNYDALKEPKPGANK